MTFALLEGLKVLDLGTFAAGPYCAKLFVDAGAGVIHRDLLGLSPWAVGRITAYDADVEQRLKQRFGPQYGPDPPPGAEDAAPSGNHPRSTA